MEEKGGDVTRVGVTGVKRVARCDVREIAIAIYIYIYIYIYKYIYYNIHTYT